MTENSLKQYLVSGSVQSADRGSIGGLIVRLVDKHIGPDVDVAETTTDETGAYQIAVTLPPATLQQKQKDKPDFQVLVYTGDTFLGASEIRYNASSRETLDVELTEGLTALPSEYELLTQGLKRAYEGNLAELQETAARQDITYLANKTQWDANAVALAALAEQFSLGAVSSPAFATPGGQPQGSVSAVALPANTPNSPGTAPLPPTRAGLAPAFFYALFRAGIPANADGLFQTSPTTVQAVWEQAIKQGVIPAALASQVSDAVQHFEALSTAHTLDANPPVGISTLREMLQTSLSDAGQQEQFARAYVHHRDDTDAFWNALQQSLGEAQTQQLRLNGKLFYLTLNNAPLVRALHDVQQHEPLASTLDLATRGYHDPAKWTSLIGTSVPSQISGDSDVEKRAKYAELLAAKVRTAHPTAVVSDHVRRGAFRLSDPSVEPAHVADFLIEHEGGFAIGQEPVEAYIARTKLAGAPAPLIGQIKRLQRVYQITPNDQTMGVLLRHDLDSAHAIARYSAAGFERTFEAKLGGPSNALAIHARAKQIHSAVLNIAVSYLGARVAPRLGGNSPVHVPFPDLPLEASSGVIAYPTLESLFGSLDYCNCRECRSILSPAAYFVDLLHFLDHPAPSQGYQNPQSELFRRRPDLQYLALTCENTNTALPYIDIVNETLEYFVANNTSLDNFRGHDTDDSVTSKELLASPQYVNDSAYDTLRSTFFPPPLPFNRPLELLRLHLAKLGVALPELMQTLRVDDAIERANRANHGWRDILMEELALSREEHQLLTELAKVGLEALYGYPVNSNALATLRDMNLQDFSRRTGVSYDDLFSIVRTQFINPNAILIPRLERLGVPFATLQALKNGPLSAAAFKAMLPEGLDAMKYGGNASTDLDSVVKWVTDAPNYARITSIVTITDPSNGPDQCSGAALQFRYSEPGSANKLTATDFVKLIRFIRLWRKLGLSITQTDDILTALYPAADMPAGTDDGANLRLLDSGFLTLLPRVGFLFRIMKQLALKADADLAPLLACWAPIGTARNDSLYHKMFLGPTVQELGPQTATIDGPVNLGDRFKTTINGIPIPDQGYVDTGDGPAIVADDIASSINRTSTIDPDSDRPLNSRVQASSQGGVITIRAGFTLECATSPGASASYASNAQSPLIHTATVAGPVTKDDVLITIINDSPFRYTVVPGDTPITIASKIALAINETTTPEPFSGVPLNTLVVASNQAEVIRFEAVNAGAPFRLACSLALVPTGTYALTASSPESWTATITVTQIPVIPTYRIITTINGIDLIFSTLGSTYTAADLANSVVNLIANASQPDPVTGRALNSLVEAQAGAMTRIGRQTTEVVITITALDRATRFKLACLAESAEGDPGGGVQTNVEYDAQGPFQPPQTATVIDTITAGSILTTTINGIAISLTTAAFDTAVGLAGTIAQAINATSTVDPDANLPLNQILSASAAGGVITVVAKPTFAVTMVCSLALAPPATYIAGREASPFADDGYGNFLQDASQKLFGHEPTLRAAFNLTGAEFTQIASLLGFTSSSDLSLANISAIFRVGWLAHKLRLSVVEFLQLRQFTGLDPFAPLDPGTAAPVEPAIVRFIRLLQSLGSAGLQPAQALYLMWNQDLSGRAAPVIGDVTGLARTLRADSAAVEAQFSLKDDPDGSIAKGLMSLVYGSAATDFFFGLLSGTLTNSVTFSNPVGQPSLAPPIIDASTGRLSYNDLRKQLSYAGVLDGPTQMAIDQSITSNGNNINLHTALTDLARANQRAVAPFFATYQELLLLYTDYAASNDPPQQKRTKLLTSFLPGLKHKRKQEQALATITAVIGTDPSFATSLLQDATVLHTAKDDTALALVDLTAIESQGLSVRLSLTENVGPRIQLALDSVSPGLQTATIGGTVKLGDVLTTTINGVSIPYTVVAADSNVAILARSIAAKINATTELDPIAKRPLNQVVSAFANFSFINLVGLDPARANTSFSVSSGATETYTAGGGASIDAIWSGYIDAPQDGFYDIYIETDMGVEVSVEIGDVSVAMAKPNNTWSNQSPIALKAGTLTPIVFTATSIMNIFSVTWETVGLGRTAVPSASLYSATLVDNLNATYVRFLKAVSLATALSLTAEEIAYLGTATDFRINTTDSRDNLAAGNSTFTPASMSKIAIGSKLVIGSRSVREVVKVTATTATTFSAVTVNRHDGTTAPFPIFSQLSPDIGRGWLNFLGVSDKSADPALAASLRDILAGLLDFTLIKQALSPKDERLLAALKNPTLPDGSPAIRLLTGWSIESLNALLQRFFGNIQSGELSSIANLRRVFDVFAIVKRCRIAAPALIAATTNAPSPASIGALQSALRALYAEPDWAALIRPINDAMRIQQRDALVAYILQYFGDAYQKTLFRSNTLQKAQSGAAGLSLADVSGVKVGMQVSGPNIAVYTTVVGVDGNVIVINPGIRADLPAGTSLTFAPQDAVNINTADKLFEYFLIDVETQPPVETSRIRLALSSVQLFIERILRNLEPSCSPSDVEDPNHAPQWPWMKRYRVWQANREVFLWPENWVYPELRDDRSPFFNEMMSALLQSDITYDAATTAYLDYLTKLESVAKLEPCGLYVAKTSSENEVAYVIARTAGARRKHYFRQFKDSSWTPWTEVKIDCDDMPITPIVWNGRLFLFWLKVLKQVAPVSVPLTNTAETPIANVKVGEMQSFVEGSSVQNSSVNVQAVLCWSEFYNNKWQPTKTSDIHRPTALGIFGIADFDANRTLMWINPARNLPNLPLVLSIKMLTDGFSLAGGFQLHNTHSLPVRIEDSPFSVSPQKDDQDRLLTPMLENPGSDKKGTFAIFNYIFAGGEWQFKQSSPILDFNQAPRYVEPAAFFQGWDAPFFFEDRRNVFYVTTKMLRPTFALHNNFGILSTNQRLKGNMPQIPSLVLQQSGARILAAGRSAKPVTKRRSQS